MGGEAGLGSEANTDPSSTWARTHQVTVSSVSSDLITWYWFLVTVNIGRPLNMGQMIHDLQQRKVEAMEARRMITEHVQSLMETMYQENKIHRSNC